MAISGKLGAVYTQTSAAPVSFVDEATLTYGNLLTQNKASVETDATGFTSYGSAVLTRDTTECLFGTASLKVVTAGSIAHEGIGVYSAIVVNKAHTASVYIKGTGTVRVYMLVYYSDSTNDSILAGDKVLTSTWTRYSMTITPNAGKTVTGYEIYIWTDTPLATTFYVDGMQLEEGSVATSWKMPTGGRTQYKILNTSKKYFDKNSIVTVKKNGVIQASGFKVEHISGLVIFDSPLSSLDVIIVSGNYLSVAQSGGFFNWSLDGGADTSEATTFQSNGWKEQQATLKEWSVSAEAYWGNSEFFDKLGTECIIILYLDTGSSLSFEGYGIITGDGIEVNVEDLINESVDIQGNGTLYLREVA